MVQASCPKSPILSHAKSATHARIFIQSIDRRRSRTQSRGWLETVAIVWQRSVADDAPPIADITEPVPYGLKIAEDCIALEQDVQEREALIVMLEMIIQDKPLSEIANELSLRGFRTHHNARLDTRLRVRHASPHRGRPSMPAPADGRFAEAGS